MKRTGKNLNDMLTLARENQPTQNLFSPEDLQCMIGQAQNVPTALFNGRGKPSLPSTLHRNQFIMISVAGLILTGAFLLYFGRQTPATRTMPHQEIADKTEHRTEHRPATPADLSESKSGLSPSGSKNNKGTVPPSPGETKPEKNEGASDSGMIAGIVINDLTPEEMGRIFGIRFSEEKAEILIEQMTKRETLEPEQLEKLARYGYDTTASEIRIRSQAVVTTQSDEFSGRTDVTGPQPEPLLTSPVGLSLFETGSQDGLGMSFEDETQLAGIGTWDDQLSEEIATLSETKGRIRPESVLSKLVAIRIPRSYRSEKGEEICRDLYVWYIPTPQLFAALPLRYQTSGLRALAEARYDEPIRPTAHEHLIPGVMRFATHSPEYGDTNRYYSRSLTQFDGNGDIGGIHFLDLTNAELEKLGIRFDEAGIAFAMQQQFRTNDPRTNDMLGELGYDVSTSIVNVGFAITADTFNMSYTELPSADFAASPVAPVLYSGRWIKPEGREGLSMIFTTKSPLLEKLGAAPESLCDEVFTAYDGDADEQELHYRVLNKLIPIRIKLESNELIPKAGKHRGGEILLWYVPTPEFLSTLPDRYRIPLERELKLITSVEEGNIPTGEACKRMAGETVIMDFCRSGAISSTRAWPNPAKETITLNYVLTAPRQIAMTLHDLSGKFLGDLTEYAAQSPGQHQVNVNLDEIKVTSGAYLVTVRTDKGEQAVQRIIVQ